MGRPESMPEPTGEELNQSAGTETGVSGVDASIEVSSSPVLQNSREDHWSEVVEEKRGALAKVREGLDKLFPQTKQWELEPAGGAPWRSAAEEENPLHDRVNQLSLRKATANNAVAIPRGGVGEGTKPNWRKRVGLAMAGITLAGAAIGGAWFLGRGGGVVPAPSPTPDRTPAGTPTPKPSAAASGTPGPEGTPPAPPTPEPTPDPTSSPTASPSENTTPEPNPIAEIEQAARNWLAPEGDPNRTIIPSDGRFYGGPSNAPETRPLGFDTHRTSEGVHYFSFQLLGAFEEDGRVGIVGGFEDKDFGERYVAVTQAGVPDLEMLVSESHTNSVDDLFEDYTLVTPDKFLSQINAESLTEDLIYVELVYEPNIYTEVYRDELNNHKSATLAFYEFASEVAEGNDPATRPDFVFSENQNFTLPDLEKVPLTLSLAYYQSNTE